MTALAKVLAVCGATAVGSASCVATGIIDPGSIAGANDPGTPAIEESGRPVEDPIDQGSLAPEETGQATADETAAAAEPVAPTPAQQATKQFSFEAGTGTPAGSGSSGGGEFGAPAASGGGGGSGGSGGGGGFGFEK